MEQLKTMTERLRVKHVMFLSNAMVSEDLPIKEEERDERFEYVLGLAPSIEKMFKIAVIILYIGLYFSGHPVFACIVAGIAVLPYAWSAHKKRQLLPAYFYADNIWQ